MKSKYLRFQELPQRKDRKTRQYAVTTRTGDLLGIISWSSPWRQYVLNPEPDTIWSTGCLKDISRFIEKANQAQAKKDPLAMIRSYEALIIKTPVAAIRIGDLA